LKLAFIAQHYAPLAQQAGQHAWAHVAYLATLLDGEVEGRRERATKSRIRLAPCPVINPLEQCRGDWPTRINRRQGQNHVHREFIQAKATLIFLGGVGLGKTPLATALGSTAGLQGDSGLFASAIAVIHTLAAAKNAGRLKAALKQYTTPALLILDELGSLPLDKAGADLLVPVISRRYEQGAIVITSNRAFKAWPKIFHHDSTLTAAILDRLLHHAETVIIAGQSFRRKDQIAGEPALLAASPEAHQPCRRRPAHPCAPHIFTVPIFLHVHATADTP
jgi:DNA replication protein DnaC